MSRNHVEATVARAGAFVNLSARLVFAILIGLGYVLAIGNAPGIA